MEATVERRRFPRREQGVVMQIATDRDHGAGLSSRQVLTSDLSVGGALFRTPDWRFFPVGARVHFTLFLDQALQHQTWHCSRLSGRGRVVRHDTDGAIDDGDWQGVAVAFEDQIDIR